jgi:thioredoxin reductase (NADPH)
MEINWLIIKKGDKDMYDIIIIGGGSAGGSAAILSARAKKKVLVIDAGKTGTKRAWLDNHYGQNGISGPELIEIGKKQAIKSGSEWIEDEVIQIKKENDVFVVHTETGEAYQASYVIIATGSLIKVAEESGLEVIPGTEPRVKKIIKTDRNGKTNIEGIWAAGVAAGASAHTIITAGDGAKVAVNIISEINGTRYVDHDVLKVSE